MGGKGLVLPAAAVGMGDEADMGDGSAQCVEHPQYSRANPVGGGGGICPLCLQDKLRRLLVPPSTTSSSSTTKPTFDFSPAVAAPLYSVDYSPSSPPSSSNAIRPTVLQAAANRCSSVASANNPRSGRRSKMIPFFQATTHHKKKMAAASSTSGEASDNVVFKRSKSVALRPKGGFTTCTTPKTEILLDSPRKKSFWSFLYLSSSIHQRGHRDHHASNCSRRDMATGRGGGHSRDADRVATSSPAPTYIRDMKLLPHPPQLPAISTSARPGNDATRTPRRECPPAAAGGVPLEEAPGNSPGSRGSQVASTSIFGRKVARCRSVGCGSRRFSGDLQDKISTVGLGYCTLRRVESQRESKHKIATHPRVPGEDQEPPPLPPHKVRCGGIFAGFSSSPSSSSSSYWPSDNLSSGARLLPAVAPAGSGSGGVENGTPRRRRSWAWAFASPMRAFTRPSGKHTVVSPSNGATAAADRTPFDSASPATMPAVGGALTVGG